MEIPGKERHSRDSQRLIKPKSTDFCHQCKMTIEDQCMRSGDTRWHLQCFKCKSCHRPLTKETAVFDANLLQCLSCAGVTCSPNSFEFVSKLSQYSFLLRIALSRLCHLLQITGEIQRKTCIISLFVDPIYLFVYFIFYF
jgi:hypothetical protein